MKISLKTTVLAIEAIVLLNVKLVLVHQREMVLEPADAFSYVHTSLYHLSIFDVHPHPLGTSYLIRCARVLGFPYRLFEEVLLVGATFLFLQPLMRGTLEFVIALPIFALVIFNPNLVMWMDHAYSDPAYLFFLLAGLGGVFGAIFADQKPFPIGSFVLIILAFSFLALVREEGPIICAEMAAAAVVSLPFFRGPEGWRFRRAMIAFGCAAATNLAVSQMMSAAAYVSHGLWGSTPVTSREWWALYSTLLALPVDRTFNHAFLNKQNVELASELSPTFALLSPCLEEARQKARKLDNGQLPWRFLECAHWKFDRLTLTRTEIIKSANIRKIDLKWPLFGIIPSPVSQWMPFLGPSILKVLRLVVANPATLNTDLVQGRDFLDPVSERVLDEGLLRRAALSKNMKNPELRGYNFLFLPIYRAVTLTGLIATSVTIVGVLGFLLSNRFGHNALILVASLISFDIAARVGFYSIVEWIGWETPPRYYLCAQVLLVFPAATLIAMVSKATIELFRPACNIHRKPPARGWLDRFLR